MKVKVKNMVCDRCKKVLETELQKNGFQVQSIACLLYTSPSPRDQRGSRMPSSA